MIARTEGPRNDIWAELAAPLDPKTIAWRQDGRPVQRDGKYIARFVAYIEANTVRERLDTVIPGEWDLTLELMPMLPSDDGEEARCSFKARLQILGVIREDVGNGKDYKQASTDAFKRAAVRFGIGHELYSYEQNWVQVDADGKYAKPVEDPSLAYARRNGKASAPVVAQLREQIAAVESRPVPTIDERAPLDEPEPTCPDCGGKMWDNRLTKKNPKAPDYKCRDRGCEGVIWPPKTASASPAPKSNGKSAVAIPPIDDTEYPFDMDDA